MKPQKKLISRLLVLCAGFMILGTAASLFVYSNLGSDPINMLSQGVARIIELEVGTTNILIQLFFFLILLLVGRKRIGLGTFVGIFIIGGMMNLWAIVLVPRLGETLLPVRLVCVVAAPILVGFGVAMVQLADLGMVPNDLLPLVIFEKIGKFQFRTVRIAYDLSHFTIGLLLGGIFGIGTILSAFLTGPSIQWALALFRRRNMFRFGEDE